MSVTLSRILIRSCLSEAKNKYASASAAAISSRPSAASPFSSSQRWRRRLSISRMLDLGGAPSSLHDNKTTRRVNAILDFDVLTRSIKATTTTSTADKHEKSNVVASSQPAQQLNTTTTTVGNVQPDVDVVQHIANLLNVDLQQKSSQVTNITSSRGDNDSYDDMSPLLSGEHGQSPVKQTSDNQEKVQHKKSKNLSSFLSRVDVGDKYAAKLAQKGVIGGVESVKRTKQHAEETLKHGDAEGHLAARRQVVTTSAEMPTLSSSTSSRWMAQSGTGALLQYMTQRSIKIALLPKPVITDKEEIIKVGTQMEDLRQQLKDVVVDVLVKDGTPGACQIVKEVLEKLQLQPDQILVVSDRDDYLRCAKDEGMFTCRIRPKNAPRGNTSTNYMVPSVSEIKDVLNEINGISYNAVLHGR